LIRSLSGILSHKSTDYLIVDVGGVGYQVFVPLSTYYDLPQSGEKIKLSIYTHVREDNLALYGFRADSEIAIFELLLSISGIGPKLACNVLSGIGSSELASAIAGGDRDALCAIPGIGKKTAERIILELQDKVLKMGALPAANSQVEGHNRVSEDAISALINLGYSRLIAEKTVRAVIEPEASFERVIRMALASLAK
jgi:holliday junction DNA helicase RuvA